MEGVGLRVGEGLRVLLGGRVDEVLDADDVEVGVVVDAKVPLRVQALSHHTVRYRTVWPFWWILVACLVDNPPHHTVRYKNAFYGTAPDSRTTAPQ